MGGTYATVMGDRGRFVVPAVVRERLGLGPGTPLVLVDTDEGLVVLTREQAKRRVADALGGTSLVADLLADRRTAAASEDET
jgi:AbrB family looped-hinge helix DNA binding protein